MSRSRVRLEQNTTDSAFPFRISRSVVTVLCSSDRMTSTRCGDTLCCAMPRRRRVVSDVVRDFYCMSKERVRRRALVASLLSMPRDLALNRSFFCFFVSLIPRRIRRPKRKVFSARIRSRFASLAVCFAKLQPTCQCCVAQISRPITNWNVSAK